MAVGSDMHEVHLIELAVLMLLFPHAYTLSKLFTRVEEWEARVRVLCDAKAFLSKFEKLWPKVAPEVPTMPHWAIGHRLEVALTQSTYMLDACAELLVTHFHGVCAKLEKCGELAKDWLPRIEDEERRITKDRAKELFQLTVGETATTMAAVWSDVQKSRSRVKDAKDCESLASSLDSHSAMLDACEEQVVSHGKLVRTVTGMICLWRSLRTGEIRATITGQFLVAFGQESISKPIRELLEGAAAGGITYHRV